TRVAGGKLFRPVAKTERRLFVAEKHVVSRAGFVVAQIQHALSKGIRRSKAAHLAIQVDSSIELEQGVYGGAIDADQKVQRPGIGYDRDADRIGQVAHVLPADDVAARVHASAHFEGINWIKTAVTIRPVGPVDRQARHRAAALLDEDYV